MAAGNKPPESDKRLKTALEFHQSGLLQQAGQIYTSLLESNPRHADALHLLGVIGIQTGDYESAVSFIQRAVQIKPNQSFFYSNLGNAFQGAGKYPQALACYDKALELNPEFVDAGFNLANTYLLQGELNEAVANYRKVIALNPNFPEAYNNMGKALQDLGSIAEAIVCYQRAVELNPAYIDAFNNMGNAHKTLENYDAGILCYKEALRLQPDSADVYYNMGNLYHDQDKIEPAQNCYRQALHFAPDHVDASNNLAKILQDLGEHDEALTYFRKALSTQPHNPDALYNLGNALKDQGKYVEAIDCYQKALTHKPDYVEAHNNMGNVFQGLEKFEAALACYQLALKRKPDYASAWNNLGKTFQELSRWEEALAAYNRSLQYRPQNADAHFNRAIALLLTGDLQNGWDEYEWRFRTDDWRRIYPHRIELPRWTGESFAGRKLFIHSEQGLGDTLQFIRYLPRVKSKGGRVILETMKSLHPLLQGFPGIDQLVEMSATPNKTVGYDFYVPLLSLPGIFRTTLTNIPAEVPYIRADKTRTARWREKLDTPKYKVGLVWAGKPSHKNDHNRSIPLTKLAPLAQIEGVALYGLQKGASGDQIEASSCRYSIQNLGYELNDFADTAAAVANLELVITVDTSVAHLAGAMGKPVWTLLPFMPDWRWLMDLDRSPWYPSMRLFRQPERGNWDAVIHSITTELSKLVGAG